jgi:hypothetical protein
MATCVEQTDAVAMEIDTNPEGMGQNDDYEEDMYEYLMKREVRCRECLIILVSF